MGLHVIEIPNSRGEGISFDLLRFVLDRYDIKAFVGMPNFSNPTGGCMSDAHKEQLVGILEEAEVPLIEDDIYADIFFGEKRPKPCKAFDTSGNVILCSSFSKVIAPGFRVGWIVPGRFYPDIENSKHLLNIGGSSLEQMIISQFLQTGGFDRHVRKLRQSLQERVQE